MTRVAAAGGDSLDLSERQMYAREAHQSATVTALLLLLWGTVTLLCVPRHFRVLSLVQISCGTIALAYFLRTLRRPHGPIAVAFITAAIVQGLIVIPWATHVWCALGRPWEAVTVPQIGMLSMALIVPRSITLGTIVLALLGAESLYTTLYARHVGLGALVSVGEPFVSLCFTLPAFGLLLLREQRRRLARRYLRLQAEAEALARLGPLFVTVRDELACQLDLLSDELQRKGDAASDATTRATSEHAASNGTTYAPSDETTDAAAAVARAVARLAEVNARLGSLVDDGAGSAGAHDAGQARGTDSTAPVANELERAFLARDAQLGAGVLTAITASVALAWVPVAHAQLSHTATWDDATIGLVALALLTYLVWTRRNPSERRARGVVLALLVVTVPLLSFDQTETLALHRPFAPFLGHKLLLVVLGLSTAGTLWLGVAYIAATALIALALWVALDMGAHHDVISVVEPWVTLVFAAVGLIALAQREQRRVASLRVLRAESAATALHRRAVMLLALRDQLNSPLQTLVLTASRLEAQDTAHDLARVRSGVHRLVAMSRSLAEIELPRDSLVTSLDATEQLRRHT